MIFTGIVMALGNLMIYGIPFYILYKFMCFIYKKIDVLFGLNKSRPKQMDTYKVKKHKTKSNYMRKHPIKNLKNEWSYKNIRKTMGKCNRL